MLLYHYSTHLHNTLKTMAVSGNMEPIKVKLQRMEARRKPYEEWAYCDHISFFFEPIPSVLLAEIFGKSHRAWFPGNKLYEHVVSTADLPTRVPFHVVESAKKTQMYDEFSVEHNWIDDDPELLAKWLLLEDRKAREWGEKGTKRYDLEKQILAHQGTITAAYNTARVRDDFEMNRTKYAANVPHLMMYPEGGKVSVHKINQVTIGIEHRRLVVPSSAL